MHCDHGSEFRSKKFLRDNSPMDSFFALPQIVLDRRDWTIRTELRIAIMTCIERTNHRR